MIYSFSEGKMFRRCQRSWFFGKRMASATAKDPLRRKAYLLSKLQSLQAWRGKIVDKVIETVVVPALKQRTPITLEPARKAARAMFDAQLNFALKRRIWEPDFKASAHENDLAAFFCVEYGQPPSTADLEQAWSEIETALTNLFHSDAFKELRATVKAAAWLVAQCPITFPYAAATVRAVPDLVCLYRSEPPLIIDWKVHFFGVHDYYQQLVSYAITLANCGSHAGLPAEMRRYPAHSVRLMEAQLLTNEARPHVIEKEDIAAVEDQIALEIRQMLLAVDGRENKELSAEDFPTTDRLGVCDTCNFRVLCWEKKL